MTAKRLFMPMLLSVACLACAGIEPGIVPTDTLYAEVVAPAEETARITVHGSHTSATDIIALDDMVFESPKQDLTVLPGCRCICAGAMFPIDSRPMYHGVPACFDARPGHTYVVSTVMEFHRNVWVNEWPNSEIGDQFEDLWAAAVDPLNGRENRLFKYRFRADGSWYPREGDPETPYCMEPPISCTRMPSATD